MITIDEKSKEVNVHKKWLLSDPELKQELIIRSPFAHGSVMFKKDAFFGSGGYRKNEWPAEDYGLWIRMARYEVCKHRQAIVQIQRKFEWNHNAKQSKPKSDRIFTEVAWDDRKDSHTNKNWL